MTPNTLVEPKAPSVPSLDAAPVVQPATPSTEAPAPQLPADDKDMKVNVLASTPFILMHVACLMVFWAGFSLTALGVMVFTYYLRAFGLTAGFHRYFAHRSYKTSRPFQFVLGWIGTSAAQLGPLWWAAHHRHHHKFSDTEQDIHSPCVSGFLYSHVGWIMVPKNKETDFNAIRDFTKYPELMWLNRHHWVPPFTLALAMYGLGWFLQTVAPGLGTSGFQMLVYGFFLSTVALYHGTFFVNSLAHVVGRRRFKTKDDSRNNWFISLLTMGEGWHNNHHRYPSSTQQGFYWYEFDPSHWILKSLSVFGIVWDLRKPPREVYEEAVRLREERKQMAS